MALTLKQKPLVAFVLLELFEDGKNGLKSGKTKECSTEHVEKDMFTARYICI